MKTTSIIALAVPLVCAGPALAQGTDAQRAACGGDAFRLCASSIPNVGRITACLRQSKAQLSPGCRAEFDKADGGATRIAAAPPPPRIAERPRPERQRLAETPRTRARVAETPAPRMTPRLAKRERLAAAPEATPRPGTKVSVSRSGNVRTVTRTVYVYVPQKQASARHAGPRRSPAGRGGGNSEMAQAMYWMRTIGGYANSMGYGSMGDLAALMR